MNFPKYVALVGHPKTGKSLVAEMLNEKYGCMEIDSGLPLRQIAMQHYGLTPHQVFTQAGKAEFVMIGPRRWQVRELLGELGNRFEEMHGDWATPWMVTRELGDRIGPFVDGACRKTQGNFYKSLGGFVIGITRPDVPKSEYKFDQVDESIPDAWINNDAIARGLSLEAARLDLRSKLEAVMSRFDWKPSLKFDSVSVPISELAQRAAV